MLNAPYTADEKITLLQILHQHFIKVFEGQAMELEWHSHKNWNIHEQDYLSMVECKTGALIAIACKIGAYLGGASLEQQKLLYKWGLSLGVAYQIQDDVLNLTGTEEKYKKEIGGDITEGKRSLMVLHTLNNQAVTQKDKQKLKSILDSKTIDQNAIQWCITLLTQSGAIAYAQKKSTDLISITTTSLKNTLTPTPAREKLLQLAYSLITREA
jgi:geranylgeranyl pyrophosphate synthase